MEMLNKLETMLAGVYKATPKLSDSAKKTIVNIWPFVAIIFGVLQLWGAYALWHWGRDVNKIADVFNSYLGIMVVVATACGLCRGHVPRSFRRKTHGTKNVPWLPPVTK